MIWTILVYSALSTQIRNGVETDPPGADHEIRGAAGSIVANGTKA
jgi:hypothetical protein